jgi:DNA integrity scanning protein DisA with diadenylate cyclase activity
MQVKDLLDILLVAAVLYVVLVWLRLSLPSGVAHRSMVAAPIAATVSLLAQAFDLYLLERVLEGLLIVVLVGAVVVYQTDIRRLFDRAFTGRAPGRPQSRLIDTLTEAVAHMAAIKMGALIAIRSRRPGDPAAANTNSSGAGGGSNDRRLARHARAGQPSCRP